MKLKIYTDGAQKGNPGPSAIAFKILTQEGDCLLKKHSECIGIRTNNQAEYEALISALNCATKLGSHVVCYTDSELIVKQINGEYGIHKPKLRSLWLKVVELKEKFRKTSFIHVSRADTHIQEVDKLAKQALYRVDSAHMAYEAWTPEEDKALIERYKKGVTKYQLAKMHKRTYGAISSRLRKLRKSGAIRSVASAHESSKNRQSQLNSFSSQKNANNK